VQWLQGSHLTLPNLIFSFVNKANLPEWRILVVNLQSTWNMNKYISPENSGSLFIILHDWVNLSIQKFTCT
jgi:hypothetical protein